MEQFNSFNSIEKHIDVNLPVEQFKYPFTLRYDNSICHVDGYMFSPAIFLEFSEHQSSDYGEAKHKGQYHFRIDYTQVGRYECEFLDHSFSYRGENEITLLATPSSEDWCITSSIPTRGYRGCALVVLLNKLTSEEYTLFNHFGICIDKLVEEISASKRWSKLSSPQLVKLFQELYDAHALSNRDLAFLKSMEMLLFISQNSCGQLADQMSTDFFPSKQIKKVKNIHEYVTQNYDQSISFERLAKENEINYPVFNKIFKQIYGDSPYQYLKKIKINLAAQKMLESDLSIMEIAVKVGYTNPSKFSDAFKSVMGVLPRSFRKKTIGLEHFNN